MTLGRRLPPTVIRCGVIVAVAPVLPEPGRRETVGGVNRLRSGPAPPPDADGPTFSLEPEYVYPAPKLNCGQKSAAATSRRARASRTRAAATCKSKLACTACATRSSSAGSFSASHHVARFVGCVGGAPGCVVGAPGCVVATVGVGPLQLAGTRASGVW